MTTIMAVTATACTPRRLVLPLPREISNWRIVGSTGARGPIPGHQDTRFSMPIGKRSPRYLHGTRVHFDRQPVKE